VKSLITHGIPLRIFREMYDTIKQGEVVKGVFLHKILLVGTKLNRHLSDGNGEGKPFCPGCADIFCKLFADESFNQIMYIHS
jgi:hypothetical protein